MSNGGKYVALLFFLLKAALADSKYQGRYWVVPLVATSCIFSAE